MPLSTTSKPTQDNIKLLSMVKKDCLDTRTYSSSPQIFVLSNDDLLQKEIHNIQTYMSWNGFPRRLAKKIISLFTLASTAKHPNIENMNVENNSHLPKIWIPLLYIGKHGLKLTNSLITRIAPILKSQCKIIII